MKKFYNRQISLTMTAVVLFITICVSLCSCTNQQKKVLKELENGNYDVAIQLYKGLEEIDTTLTVGLVEQLDQMYSDFKNSVIDYETVQRKLNTITKMDLSDISDKLFETKRLVSELNDSRTAFDTAVAFENEKDYKNAIANYEKVIEEDNNYSTAQTSLDTCIEVYRSEVLNTAADHADTEAYSDAISVLNDALTVLENDSQLTTKLNVYTQASYDLTKKNALAEAAKHAEAKDYVNAISVLTNAKGLKDDPEVKNKLSEYSTTYENNILTQVDTLLGQRKYDEAETLLFEALKILADNEKLTAKDNSINDLRPVGLEKLILIDSTTSTWHGYEYKEDSFTDVFGTVYDGVHYYEGVYNEKYSIHNLNSEFTEFTGSIVAGLDTNNGKTYSIRIYVDDVLKFSKTGFTKTEGKVDFSIDVTGGKILTIKVVDEQTSGDTNEYIGIVNTLLYK